MRISCEWHGSGCSVAAEVLVVIIISHQAEVLVSQRLGLAAWAKARVHLVSSNMHVVERSPFHGGFAQRICLRELCPRFDGLLFEGTLLVSGQAVELLCARGNVVFIAVRLLARQPLCLGGIVTERIAPIFVILTGSTSTGLCQHSAINDIRHQGLGWGVSAGMLLHVFSAGVLLFTSDGAGSHLLAAQCKGQVTQPAYCHAPIDYRAAAERAVIVTEACSHMAACAHAA